MYTMALLNDAERDFAVAVSHLAYVNPFLPERIEWERRAIGEEHVPFDAVWHVRAGLVGQNPNETRIAERTALLAEALRERLATGARATATELELYQDLVFYLLYYRYQTRLQAAALGTGRKPDFGFYGDFAADFERFLSVLGVLGVGRLRPRFSAAHLFACCFQVRRAFHATFRSIVGGSMPAAHLRARVWQSIFTHDLRRYQSSLYQRLGDVTTLVTGPSGTGKEIVARAIALSRHLPFDPTTKSFGERHDERLGDTKERRFRGKVVAATNRDLAAEMRVGRFREDLYYRLCADRIETPSLAERIRDTPRELDDLVLFLSQRLVGEEVAPELAREVVEWIDRRLGRGYPWPGNVRELAQCVSNVLIHREYVPAGQAGREPSDDPKRALAEEILGGHLSADELLSRYATLVYAETGSYQEAARRLGLDRRTIKARVDVGLLARLRGEDRAGAEGSASEDA